MIIPFIQYDGICASSSTALGLEYIPPAKPDKCMRIPVKQRNRKGEEVAECVTDPTAECTPVMKWSPHSLTTPKTRL